MVVAALVGVLLVFLLAFVASAGARGAAPRWVEQTPPTHPPGRSNGAMASDAARGTTVLFGGFFPYRDDTWTYDGTTWTQRFPATHPPGRGGATIAYDSARQEVVLFGGQTSAGIVADTWTWDGTTWTQRFPATSPPARSGATMAYDAARQQVVLFGGNRVLSDTWTWDGTTWTRQLPAHSPPPRESGAMDYDAVRANTVLFSGTSTGGIPGAVNDTWTWDGVDWTQRSPTTSPAARFGHRLSFDPAIGKTVMFGGNLFNGPNGFTNETWLWDGTNWEQQRVGQNVPTRALANMAFNVTSNKIVLFSGYAGAPIFDLANDTWTYGTDHCFGHDERRGAVVRRRPCRHRRQDQRLFR